MRPGLWFILSLGLCLFPLITVQAAEDLTPGGNPDAQPTPWPGNRTDCSGTIATGGQAQTLVSANERRRHLLVVNQSPDTLVVRRTRLDAADTAATVVIRPRSSHDFAGLAALENGFLVTGPRSGSAYSCEEG